MTAPARQLLVALLLIAAPAAAGPPAHRPAAAASHSARRTTVPAKARPPRNGIILPATLSPFGPPPGVTRGWLPVPRPVHTLGLFRHFNATVGPVPFGAPTAREFRDLTTPLAFRTPPAVDIGALISYFRHRAEARHATRARRSGTGKP